MWIGLFLWINNPSANFALSACLLWFGDILPPSYDFGCTPVQQDCAWWLASRKPIQFGQFSASQALHNPSTYSTGCYPVILLSVGLQNTTALSIILFHSAMLRPNRILPNLYELWKNICQTAIGWWIVQIGWRIVNLQKQSYSHLQEAEFLPTPLKFFK